MTDGFCGFKTDAAELLASLLRDMAADMKSASVALTVSADQENTYETCFADAAGKLCSMRYSVVKEKDDLRAWVIVNKKGRVVGGFDAEEQFDFKQILKIARKASCAVCVPVEFPGGITGSLIALRKDGDRRFIKSDERKLAAIAERMNSLLLTTLLLNKYQTRTGQLESFMRVSALINSSLELDVILDSVLRIATHLVGAEASSIMLVNEESKDVFFKTTIGSKAKKLKRFKLELGKGIAGWVALNGLPALVPDVRKDPRYSAHIAKKINFVTRNILCVPMKVKNHIIGSIEVINKIGGRGACFDNEDLYMLSAIASQAAIAIENSHLYNQAITDELTGLYTFRYFQTSFQRAFRRAGRRESSISLLILDLDNFKAFNDNYGHEMGNHLLRAIAEPLRDCVRDSDVVARYGGEEFVIILPDVDKKSAVEIAERIKAEIGTMKILDVKLGKLGVTCSIGVASYPEDATDEEALFFNADKALYKAKSDGKNRVRAYK
ncbi:MAG: sensor domain-containing diguanylate cyclase [bacterium]